MSNKTRIRNSTLGIIVGLEISILWIFMGLESGFRFEAADLTSYWLTLGGHRHTIMTILALIFVPICSLEKMWGFLAAAALGGVTLTLSLIHVVHMLVAAPSGFESQLFGPLVWSIIQIPIIVFSYKGARGLQKKITMG